MKEIGNASLYDELEITSDATQHEIKTAFKRLSKLHHPDTEGGDEDRFKRINLAYQTLSDPKKRENYDATGNSSGKVDFDQAFQQKIFPIMKHMVEHHRRNLEVDMISEIEQCLSFECGQYRKKIKELEHQVRFSNKIIDRLKSVEGVKNLIAEAYKKEVKNQENEIKATEQAIEFNKRCSVNLESYIYEHEPEEDIDDGLQQSSFLLA